LRDKNYKQAIKDATESIRLDAEQVYAYDTRGDAYFGLGDYERAIADYTQSIKFGPVYAEPWFDRGRVYYKKGDLKKAIADWEAAVKLEPDNAEYQDALVKAKTEKAQTLFQLVKSHPLPTSIVSVLVVAAITGMLVYLSKFRKQHKKTRRVSWV